MIAIICLPRRDQEGRLIVEPFLKIFGWTIKIGSGTIIVL